MANITLAIHADKVIKNGAAINDYSSH